MKVAAVMIVRDEADILSINVAHHLALGIDEFWIIDNGSTDGTTRLLRKLTRRGVPIRWQRDDGPFAQSAMTSTLARDAHRAGADWVVAVDADEFWTTSGPSLHRVLGTAGAGVGALAAEVVNYVQARWVGSARSRALLTMTRRAPAVVGTNADAHWLVEHRHAAYVETAYPPKLVSRATATMTIAPGNHGVDGVVGTIEPTGAITCLHAPLRARDRIAVKAQHAERMSPDAFRDGDGWQPRRWRSLPSEALDHEWRANSYEGLDLDVFGFAHSLVTDTRLRSVVLPHFSWADRARASLECRAAELRARRTLRRDQPKGDRGR